MPDKPARDNVLIGLGLLAALVVLLAFIRPAGQARSDISLYECSSTVATI